MTIEMLPLNQLVPSTSNARKTNAATGIEELAASIEAHGLLQNLQVRRTAGTGTKVKFEVVAGGRRLAAMTILRRQKKLAKDFLVPCHIIDEADAGEISLAENTVRLAMHPADQFVAFHALFEHGMGIEDIAARFGASPVVVRQRLKLASVSPLLIGAYREGDMTLDQLMAFTVSDNHTAQETAWYDQPEYNRSPHSVRAILTDAQVEADDRRVMFIGLDVYLSAGGGMNRDLFQPEHEGYLTDPALLDKLVHNKLTEAAEKFREEGWAWVEIMLQRSLTGYGRVRATRQPLSDEQTARQNELSAAYDALADTYGDDAEPEVAAQMESLWEEIEAIDAASYRWKAEDMARAGAVLSLDYNGSLSVERGVVRPEDVRRHQSETANTKDDERETLKPKGLSAALVESLTAERSAALRAMMMDNRQVALASMCHALASPLFFPVVSTDHSCLQIRLVPRDLGNSADTIASNGAGLQLAQRHAVWEAQLPASAEELFGWLIGQDISVLLELLTYCAASSIDAVRGKMEREDHPRFAHGDALAHALRLDMREWWKPTKANYLGRVPKSLVLDAVRDAVSPQAAENLSTLKKDRLAESAEERLAGTGWLPALLRAPVRAEAETGTDLQQAA